MNEIRFDGEEGAHGVAWLNEPRADIDLPEHGVLGHASFPPSSPLGRDGDLDAYVREGDDGSWQVLALYDPERESECIDKGPSIVPSPRCIPTHAYWAELFGDALCTTRVVESDEYACSPKPPLTIIESRNVPGSCGSTIHYELYEIAEARNAALPRRRQCELRAENVHRANGTRVRAGCAHRPTPILCA